MARSWSLPNRRFSQVPDGTIHLFGECMFLNSFVYPSTNPIWE